MNSKMLDELREMAEEKNLDTNTGIRLMLASQAQIIDDIKDVKEDISGIKKNPVVCLGNFIEKKPKMSIGLLFMLLVLINVWSASGFRETILVLLGVSPELIGIIVRNTPVP